MFSLPAISDLQGLVERCPRSVPPRSGPDGRRDLPRPELRRLDRLEMRKESRGAAVQLMVQNTDHIEQRLGSMAIYQAMLGSSPTKPWQLIQTPQFADPSSPSVMASKTRSYVRRISILLSSVMSLTHRGSNRLSLYPSLVRSAWVINATRRRDGNLVPPQQRATCASRDKQYYW